MAMGELEAHVFGAVQKLGKASARDVMKEMDSRHLAYTTISTVLDRLHQKGMVKRTRVVGRGGTKYVYSTVSSTNLRVSLVNRTLDRLVSAFGPSIVPTIYDSLEEISKEDAADLKRKVAKAQKSGRR
jgi:predicted transcriptional regulator